MGLNLRMRQLMASDASVCVCVCLSYSCSFENLNLETSLPVSRYLLHWVRVSRSSGQGQGHRSKNVIYEFHWIHTFAGYWHSAEKQSCSNKVSHLNCKQLRVVQQTRNSSGDEIPERDIALFCYSSCVERPGKGFPWDNIRKIWHRGQRMAKVQNGKEILLKV